MNLGELHRRDYGRILASLIRVTRDFALAEDAVQEAFAVAVAQWPMRGVPPNPVAWLTLTARHKAIDQLRRRAISKTKEPEMIAEIEGTLGAPEPADLLRLIYTCCHPALAREAQVALTLHTLCGLTTEEIARAFLVPVPTLAQRLVRAKNKIALAGIPYAVPAAEELPERTAAVLAVVYLVFNAGYSAGTGTEVVRAELCTAALRLGRQLVELLPAERETQGLLALMLLNDARRETRTDAAGELVLLEEQDRTRWDRTKIAEGTALVEAAVRAGPAGSYTIQAAIAALHAQAPSAAETDWPEVVALYDLLARVQPSPVVALNRAVAVAMAGDIAGALAAMERIDLPRYHLLPAARADLLRRLGRYAEAATAYREALAWVGSEVERRFLERRLAEVEVGRRE